VAPRSLQYRAYSWIDCFQRLLHTSFRAQSEQRLRRVIAVLQITRDAEDHYRVGKAVDGRLHTQMSLQQFAERAFTVLRQARRHGVEVVRQKSQLIVAVNFGASFEVPLAEPVRRFAERGQRLEHAPGKKRGNQQADHQGDQRDGDDNGVHALGGAQHLIAFPHHGVLIDRENLIRRAFHPVIGALELGEVALLRGSAARDLLKVVELGLILGPRGAQLSGDLLLARFGDVGFLNFQLGFEQAAVLRRLLDPFISMPCDDEQSGAVHALDRFFHPLRRQHASVVVL
jgi:hypothetical protein